MKGKCCGTCLHSRWALAKNGRVPLNSAGRCYYPLPTMVLPDSITKAYGWHGLVFPRSAIWAKSGDECPCYEENTGKPLPI